MFRQYLSTKSLDSKIYDMMRKEYDEPTVQNDILMNHTVAK